MLVDERAALAAADYISSAVAAVIRGNDESLTRRIVPELDRIRAVLLRSADGLEIRLDEAMSVPLRRGA